MRIIMFRIVDAKKTYGVETCFWTIFYVKKQSLIFRYLRNVTSIEFQWLIEALLEFD